MAPAGSTPRAIRLTFSYHDGRTTLAAVQRLEMQALPSHPVAGYEGQSGFWVELRDSAGRVLHRSILHDPFPHETEVYPAAEGGEFTRIAKAEPSGTFDVVVPDLPGARTVSVFASLPEPGPPKESEGQRFARVSSARTRPAQEIARFPLSQER